MPVGEASIYPARDTSIRCDKDDQRDGADSEGKGTGRAPNQHAEGGEVTPSRLQGCCPGSRRDVSPVRVVHNAPDAIPSEVGMFSQAKRTFGAQTVAPHRAVAILGGPYPYKARGMFSPT